VAVKKGHMSVRNLSTNVANNMGFASRNTAILTEIRNVSEGIAEGSFKRVAVNTGLLAATAAVGGAQGGVQKVGEQKLTANFIAGMSMGMIPFDGERLSKSENTG